MNKRVKRIKAFVKRLQKPEGHGDYWKGYDSALNDILSFIDSMEEEPVNDKLGGINNALNQDRAMWNKEEPVSEDLEKALAREWKGYNDRGASTVDALEDNTQELAFAKGFYLGAEWKEQQFEKNRLAACDRQTEEEADIERDFVMSIIEKEHRQPTFDDAIKYGMTLQKKQMKEALRTEYEKGRHDAIEEMKKED